MTQTIQAATDIGIVTASIANEVLWTFDRGGIRPGGFNEALYAVIAKADELNRARLRRAYPVHVAAWSIAHNHPEGIDILRATVAAGVA